MKRRAFIAALPTIVLAGCATRLGLADRLLVTRKSVRLEGLEDDAPVDAAVREYDPDEGSVGYREDLHEALSDDLAADEPLVIPDGLAERLRGEFATVEFAVRVCDPDSSDDCHRTTLVREDFNDLEAGDVVDLVDRDSGAGLVGVHERRTERH